MNKARESWMIFKKYSPQGYEAYLKNSYGDQYYQRYMKETYGDQKQNINTNSYTLFGDRTFSSVLLENKN